MKHAIFNTNKGSFTVELDDEKAPQTVENFLNYIHGGQYTNTIFHRVINGFMVQGGGFEPGMKQKTTGTPISNEANNGLKNLKYTLAMARTNDPHSATAQFFINVNDNGFLDYSSPTPQGWGYAVFGRVTEGQDVVDTIRLVKTGSKGFHQDVPVEDVVVTEAYELDQATGQWIVRADPTDTATFEAALPETPVEAKHARGETTSIQHIDDAGYFDINIQRAKGTLVTTHEVAGAETTLQLEVGDEPNAISGANHRYDFSGFSTAGNASENVDADQRIITLLFQNGTIPEVGVNGVTLEAVLAACGHRLEGFQSGKFACADNQEALDAINKAIEALQRRTRNRLVRGVEGTHTA